MTELVTLLGPYQSALMVLAGTAIIALVQSFLCAPLSFIKEEQVPGMPLRLDHSRLSFRAIRTYQNSVESLPPFLAALLLAIMVGVPAGAVNGLAVAYLVFRLAFWAIYYSGIGRVAGGARTLAYVGGLLANLALAGWALVAIALN